MKLRWPWVTDGTRLRELESGLRNSSATHVQQSEDLRALRRELESIHRILASNARVPAPEVLTQQQFAAKVRQVVESVLSEKKTAKRVKRK